MHLRYPCVCCGHLTLNEDFIAIGACEVRFLEQVRPPDGDEPLDPNWRPIDLSRDRFESWAARVAAWPDDLTVLYWWRYRDNGFWRRG
ncbi:hypothetical protein [Streptomyces goshikiensis]